MPAQRTLVRPGAARPEDARDASGRAGVGRIWRGGGHRAGIAAAGRELRVVWQAGDHGGRLAFFSGCTDAAYWDIVWRDLGLSYRRSRRGHLPYQLRSTFLRWVAPGGRVLEAGCGLAHFTVAARARGFAAEGVDWAPETLGRIRALLPDVPLRLADVRRLDCPDASYDAVYSPGVCEHFAEGPEQILAETYRVLKPGGIAIVSTPCLNEYLRRRRHLYENGSVLPYEATGKGERSTDPVTSASEPASEAPWNDFYQYAFTPEGMSAILRGLGFEVVDVRLHGTLLTLATWSFPWLGRLPGWLGRLLGFTVDSLPVLRRWGASCIWVARRPLSVTGVSLIPPLNEGAAADQEKRATTMIGEQRGGEREVDLR